MTGAGYDWAAHDPADPRDRPFADALADPPRDPAAALLGVPYDGAVLGRPGARDGPRAIREALAGMETHRFTGPSPGIAARDRGDVALDAEAPVDEAHAEVQAAAREAREAGPVPVSLGGDHSLTYPLARPHAEAADTLGVVNVDAHLDVREVRDGPNSGSSFGRLLRDGLVAGEHLAEVGVRDFATSGHYARWAQEQGATVVPAEQVRREGVAAAAEAALEPLAEVDAVYVSLDADALDQAHAPGVSAPTPGGLSSGAFAALARALVREAPAPVAGVDLVEVAPRHDPSGRTARAAALALAHVLAELSPEASP